MEIELDDAIYCCICKDIIPLNGAVFVNKLLGKKAKYTCKECFKNE